jgi:glyoxylase-like metal-dependent hydrolase (beta-lactamase superfamily II)
MFALPRLARLAVAAFIVLASAAQAQDFSKVEFRATKLSDTLTMLQGAGGNIVLSAGDDAVFLVDDDYAPLTPKLKAAIAQVTKRPVNFALNTHWHFDHVGGNEALAKEAVIIFAHDNVRKRMSTEQFIAMFQSKVPASPRGALPIVTFSADLSLHINGEEIRALHVPNAHTDGDVLVQFRGSDVLHMGDTFFNGTYPFIDVSSGGSAEGLVAALDRALAIATDKTRIVPGHGPLSNKAELQTWRDMVATVTQRIKDLRKAGRTDAEIKAERPTQDFDARYAKGFMNPERFMDMMLGAVGR